MRRIVKLSVLIALAILFLIPLVSDPTTKVAVSHETPLRMHEGVTTIAADQDLASWWNSSFIYRRYYNFTEPGVSDRVLTPVHLYLTFESGHCYHGSIRVMYYNNPGWSEVPYKIWNTTYDTTGNYILSTRVTFSVNVSKGATESNYYIYYSKYDVGSVDYPNYYPFVYKSYTFSLINLVSYYDNNKYYVELYDSANKVWKDPRLLDSVWSAGTMTPNNVPSGTLDKFEVVRYEPNSYSYTAFRGYYAIYSYYPLAVEMGQGNIGSNPAINDWYPGVNELGWGTGTQFILGGVEGFESHNEGKYWVQAMEDNTEVWVWTTGDSPDTGWLFYNGSAVNSWPAKLKAGEYVSKRDVVYTTYMKVNSSKPVATRQGDSDCTYARDIWAFYPSVTGALAGDEFYTINMGHSRDRTRVTNLGDSTVIIEYWTNAGSGWSGVNTLSIPANSSVTIGQGTSSSSNQEDLLHIKGPAGSKLMVEGLYRPTSATDAGDWVPTVTGHRYGSRFKLWGINGYKFIIVAQENARVDVTGYNSGTLYIPAGGVAAFRPVSGSMSLYHIVSNVSIGVVDLGRFSTSSPYNPTGDTGYGWMVPAYSPENDQNGFQIDLGSEVMLYELDITVKDLNGDVVSGASVILCNETTGAVWYDSEGLNRTGVTNANGMVVFEGLSNGTYRINVKIDAATWLYTSYSHIWITKNKTLPVTQSVVPTEVVLDMASLNVQFHDLMGDLMADTPNEDIYLRACDDPTNESAYVHQAQANSIGWIHFPRLPAKDYYFRARYVGENSWNSYSYNQTRQFANWSISSTEFASGTIIKSNWVFPLITIQIHVHSWDNLAVPNAHIQLNNTVDPLTYQITPEVSDANGNFTFRRIVNGTWQLNVWRYDDFGLEIHNNTASVVLSDCQGFISFEVQLRLTRLKVQVQRNSGGNIEGATVTVYLNNQTVVASGQTDSSGNIVFQWIRGNMSDPWFYWYTVYVVKGSSHTNGRVNVSADSDYTHINLIKLPDPTYSQTYTEISTSSGFNQTTWYQNFVFTFEYYNLTGGLTADPENITYDASTTVSFTIYSGSTFIGSDTWTTTSSTYITLVWTNGRRFQAVINLQHWKLNASSNPYRIVLSAHTDGFDNPENVTIYLTVNPAQTTMGYETNSITEHYKTHSPHGFWLHDTSNNENVTGLTTYNYEVKSGTVTLRTGTLSVSGAIYSLPASALHGLDVGSYLITITLKKQNYVNQSMIVAVTIDDVPMTITNINVIDYNWAPLGGVFTFNYQLTNGSQPSLQGVTVIIRWYTAAGVSYVNDTRVLPSVAGVITYTFSRDIVPAGDWNLTIICSKDNYELATATPPTITVHRAATVLTVSGSSSTTVDWLDTAVFTVTYTRVEDASGILNAAFYGNWSSVMSVESLGSGNYRISLDTSIHSGTHVLHLIATAANHMNATKDLTVVIRIPLIIETDYGSIENPLQAYWTRTFLINITLLDQSTGTQIDSATVTYNWYAEFIVDEQGSLTGQGNGIYLATLNASHAIPQDDLYRIILTATATGATDTSSTVFVKINAVPNEIVLEHDFYDVYYADVFDIRFYWNNTLDNKPITSASESTYYLVTLGKYITTGVNEGAGWYHFTVDTRALEMNTNGATVYVIQITHVQNGYQAHELTFVIILVRETDASLVVHPIGHVNWSDSFTITADLYDALHGGTIWIGAQITISYGTYSTTMTNLHNGTFTGTIDSDAWFAASATAYNLTFTYTLPNYVNNVNFSLVIIDPIPGVINKDLTIPDHIVVTWGWNVTVRVSVNNVYESPSVPIDNTAVYCKWAGYDISHRMTFLSTTHDYYIQFNSSEIPAGEHTLVVYVVNENFTIADLQIPTTVNPISTVLFGDVSSLTKIVGVDQTARVVLTYQRVGGSPLLGANVHYDWAGLTRTGTPSGINYICEFNPSDTTLDVPGVYILTFHAELQNYTTQTYNVTLRLVAQTDVQVENQVLQSDQILHLQFKYIDLKNNREVPASAIIQLAVVLPDGTTVPVNLNNHDSHGYYVDITASSIGVESTDAYQLYILATAMGYQNHTASEYPAGFTVLIIEPQVELPLLSNFIGPIPRSWLLLGIGISAVFLVAIGGAVAIRRMRIPYQIKQINKALKAIENQKPASVVGIKTMGQVISDLLAPGLAELNIPAPVIELGPEGDVFGEETEGLLDELDALEGISEPGPETEERPDYEAELEAELEAETVTEVPPEEQPTEEIEDAAEGPSPETPETEEAAVPEESAEEAVEEIEPEESEAEAEAEEVVEEEADAPEPDEVETEAEIEEETVEPEPEQPAAEPEVEESATEESSLDETQEESSERPLEVAESYESLTKKELIERLPASIRDSMSEEELKRLSKRELIALLESAEGEEE